MKWIDIEERLPPQDVYVLIALYEDHKTGPFTHVQPACRYGYQWVDGKDGEEISLKRRRVTHWMPIPDPPDTVVGFPEDAEVSCSPHPTDKEGD